MLLKAFYNSLIRKLKKELSTSKNYMNIMI